jgi:hypothetical protein
MGLSATLCGLLVSASPPLAATQASAPADPAADSASVSNLPETRAQLLPLVEETLSECGGLSRVLADPAVVKAAQVRAGWSPAKTMRLVDFWDRMSRGRKNEESDMYLLRALYMVDALGNPRYGHVETHLASGANLSNAIQATLTGIRSSAFQAASVNGQPVAAWRTVALTLMVNGNMRVDREASPELLRTLSEARAGDGSAQITVAQVALVNPILMKLTAQEKNHYLAVGAVVGEESVLDFLAELVASPDCQPSPSVVRMVDRQARDGKSSVALLVATRRLSSDDPGDVREIKSLLQVAANGKQEFVRLWAAQILATYPNEALRDPALALTTALELKDADDPDVLELRAAAFAANGRFREAIDAQLAALQKAKSYQWKLDYLQHRLSRYQAGEAFVGNLCDCSSLLPGSPR